MSRATPGAMAVSCWKPRADGSGSNRLDVMFTPPEVLETSTSGAAPARRNTIAAARRQVAEPVGPLTVSRIGACALNVGAGQGDGGAWQNTARGISEGAR